MFDKKMKRSIFIFFILVFFSWPFKAFSGTEIYYVANTKCKIEPCPA